MLRASRSASSPYSGVMRLPIRLAVLLLAVTAVIAACGSDAGSPAAEPVTGPPPTPVDGQTQPDVIITAQNIAWEPTEVTVRAGAPFTIGFDNRDSGVPHNLVLTAPSGEIVVQTEIVAGPAHVDLRVPALEAGTYAFTCQVHPNMVGSLTAE
jgi:plastocyanin